MPIEAVLAALAAAFIHASWNAILRSGTGDRVLDAAGVALGWAIAGAAMIAYSGPPPLDVWPYLLASSLVHASYIRVLAAAYGKGDLSHVYTVARGVPPVIIALGAFIWAQEAPGAQTALGLVLICAGIFAVGFSPIAPASATLFALIVGVHVATYSLIDAFGARASQDAIAYTGAMIIGSAIALLALVAVERGPSTIFNYWRTDLKTGLIAGAAGGIGYGLILWAQTVAPIAPIAALRETSIVFGALIGFFFLRESVGRRRWTGAAIVSLGAGLIALSSG